MNGFKKKLITLLIASVMVLVTALPAVAEANKVLSLPANQVWVTAGNASRSGNFSYVSARCHSVYPNSGMDTFSTIQCRVANTRGTIISDKTYLLSESAATYTEVKLKEGYLSSNPVRFDFRGNTSAAAGAVVSYHG
ncbi:MAG: hypothetical protein ACI4D6_01005 [Chordicoccus sp.]|jgi:hypothetical protein